MYRVSENERHTDRAGGRERKDDGATDGYLDHLAHIDGQEHHRGGFLRRVGLRVQGARRAAVQAVE